MQQNGPKQLGFFGTRNMGFMHQNLIEILSYAMVLTVSASPNDTCQFPLGTRTFTLAEAIDPAPM